MRGIITTLNLLLLGAWLGAAIFFGAAVAPSLFDVLRGANLTNANEIAGSIVTRLLAIINRSGFEIGLFAIVTAYFISRGERRFARLIEMISLAIVAIMTGVNQWVLSPRMLALRASMQLPIDQIAHDDPRRLTFDRLHGYSVKMMGAAIIAGLVAFLIMARRSGLVARR